MPRLAALSRKRRGQGGEDQAALTLKLLGFDVHTVGAKQLRYFRDQSGVTRLGWSLKDDGDILGLFDILAWGATLSLRLQVKDHEEVVAPDAKWRAAVEGLHHNTLDCWWSRDPSGSFWWSWELHNGVWWYRTISLAGREESVPQLYIPGKKRTKGQ